MKSPLYSCYEGAPFLQKPKSGFYKDAFRVGNFNMKVHGEWLTFAASLKWPLETHAAKTPDEQT